MDCRVVRHPTDELNKITRIVNVKLVRPSFACMAAKPLSIIAEWPVATRKVTSLIKSVRNHSKPKFF